MFGTDQIQFDQQNNTIWMQDTNCTQNLKLFAGKQKDGTKNGIYFNLDDGTTNAQISFENLNINYGYIKHLQGNDATFKIGNFDNIDSSLKQVNDNILTINEDIKEINNDIEDVITITDELTEDVQFLQKQIGYIAPSQNLPDIGAMIGNMIGQNFSLQAQINQINKQDSSSYQYEQTTGTGYIQLFNNIYIDFGYVRDLTLGQTQQVYFQKALQVLFFCGCQANISKYSGGSISWSCSSVILDSCCTGLNVEYNYSGIVPTKLSRWYFGVGIIK